MNAHPLQLGFVAAGFVALAVSCSAPELPETASAGSSPATGAGVASPSDPGVTPDADVAAAEAEAAKWEQEHEKLVEKLNQAASTAERRAVADKFAAEAQITLTPDGEYPCLLHFELPQDAVEPFIAKHQEALQKGGWYLFRFNQNYNFDDRPDDMALLPTDDKYEVLTLVQTNGANYGLEPNHIVAWLRQREPSQPFILTDAGEDYLAGKFTTPIADPQKLADEMYEFCPDIVDQGLGDVESLVEELKKQQAKLYFWWD